MFVCEFVEQVLWFFIQYVDQYVQMVVVCYVQYYFVGVVFVCMVDYFFEYWDQGVVIFQ